MAKRSAGGSVEVEKKIEGFLAKYSPPIQSLARACRAKLQKILPGAVEMVYDKRISLVFGFGPSEKPSEAVFSLVLYTNWINFFFLRGVHLPDPHRVLTGSGSLVRHFRVSSVADFDRTEVRDLIGTALMNAKPIDPKAKKLVVIKFSVAESVPPAFSAE